MRAILDGDRIVRLTIRDDIGTEVGPLPKGVGLERLRFNGERVVDLAELSALWVRERGGAFELHAVEVAGSQKVAMTYRDRKRLINDAGTIRVKTSLEQQKEEEEAQEGTRLVKESKTFIDALRETGPDKYVSDNFSTLPTESQAVLIDICKTITVLVKRQLT